MTNTHTPPLTCSTCRFWEPDATAQRGKHGAQMVALGFATCALPQAPQGIITGEAMRLARHYGAQAVACGNWAAGKGRAPPTLTSVAVSPGG